MISETMELKVWWDMTVPAGK